MPEWKAPMTPTQRADAIIAGYELPADTRPVCANKTILASLTIGGVPALLHDVHADGRACPYFLRLVRDDGITHRHHGTMVTDITERATAGIGAPTSTPTPVMVGHR